MEEDKIEGTGEICAQPEFRKKPSNPDELHDWVLRFCGVNIPRKAVCSGHDAPLDYLWHVFNEPAQDSVVWAPRGGGKTRLGALATLLDLVHKPGCSVRILSGSLQQCMNMWEHLCGDIEHAMENEDFQCELQAYRARVAQGAAARVLSQSQKAVRGLRVQKLRCDEVELFDRRVWEAAQLVTRTRSDLRKGGAVVSGVVEVFSTLHRPFGLMQEVVDSAVARGTRVFKWCLLDVLEKCPEWRDCESCTLLPECGRRAKKDCDGFFSIDDAIRMKSRVSADIWETEMLCLRPATTRCVFPMFSRELHVRDSVDEIVEYARGELWLGIDFGFAAPFVCLWIMKYPANVVHVIDEYVQTQRTIHEHVAEIRRREEHGVARRIGCDPAGSAASEQTAKSNVRVLEEAGFVVRKRGSHIQEGLELIRTRLKDAVGETRLFIHSNCVNLIRALGSYRYPENPKGETPLKDGTHDHLIDALRYYFVNQVSYRCEERRY